MLKFNLGCYIYRSQMVRIEMLRACQWYYCMDTFQVHSEVFIPIEEIQSWSRYLTLNILILPSTFAGTIYGN